MKASIRYKSSIRYKLFAAMSGLIVFYVLMSWILNNGFLDTYYFYSKKSMLMDNYKLLYNKYNGNPENIVLELEVMQRMSGMHIIIQDSNFDTLYDSQPRVVPGRPRTQASKQQPQFNMSAELNLRSRAEEIRKKKTIVENVENSRLGSDFINLMGTMNNGDYIFISTPVEAIKESVDISNKFFLFTGIITILTGVVIIYLLSGRFTRPILELNKIAQGMAVLDFNKRYNVTSHDEIGELGYSINSLSEQLEASISELKGANEKLRQDIERERKIDEMRKEFINSVSHELKTPIALIQGYAEGLKVNVNDDEENKNYYCEVISDEAVKMNKLVMQLLDLSQIQSGEVELDRSSFEITPLIEQVLKKNVLMFKEKGVKASLEKEREFTVDADYDRVEQVFTNYITNALNHVDERKTIKVSVKEDNGKVKVSVFNSGYHIPEESREKIWKSFYKIDKARTRAYGGTGLGLSIIRAIQEAHGNAYGVENVEDGVVFWFELDMCPEINTNLSSDVHLTDTEGI